MLNNQIDNRHMTKKEFTDKAVIITGGTQGIGRAAALAFLASGAKVIANYYGNDQKAHELEMLSANYHDNLRVYKADIANKEQREKLIEFCLNEFKRIDILINNAAIVSRLPFLEATEEETQRLVDINIMAPFFLTQKAVKQMIAQKTGGIIINVSSIFAHQSSGFAASYDMSKAAISMFSKTTANELAKFNIRVNTVSPGFTFTEQQQQRYQNRAEKLAERITAIPLNRVGTPEDIANAILFLASDAASYITATELIVDGGWSSYLPMRN